MFTNLQVKKFTSLWRPPGPSLHFCPRLDDVKWLWRWAKRKQVLMKNMINWQWMEKSVSCAWSELNCPKGILTLKPSTFYACRSQKRKKIDYLTVIFTHLGSSCAKAAHRTLMKLSPDVKAKLPFSIYAFLFCTEFSTALTLGPAKVCQPM